MEKKLFLFLIIFIGLVVVFNIVAASDPRPLEIDYPEIGGLKPTTTETLLPDYIKYIFNLSLLIIGIIVFISLLFGGFLYLTSFGNPTNLSNAKDRMFGAIIGLVLLLTSWLILNAINPQLTVFYPLELQGISTSPAQIGSATLINAPICSWNSSGPTCDTDNDCDNNMKCFDIFANGNKKCLFESDIISFSKVNNLAGYDWDNVNGSIIFYGNNNEEIRICADADFQNCTILKKPANEFGKCFDVNLYLGGLGDNQLSSFEVMLEPKGARLYEHPQFSGDYSDFEATSVGSECYQQDELGNLYGKVSSIEVAPGYWTVLCDMLDSGCGWGGSNIIRNDYNASKDPAYYIDPDSGNKIYLGDPNLSNNSMDEDRTNKVCVVEYAKGCGGVLVWGNNKTDFIKRGERVQFGTTETIIENNSVEALYNYVGDCNVTIWEKAGTGIQKNSLRPNEACSADNVCCGRTWTSGVLGTNAILNFFNKRPDTNSDLDQNSCYSPGTASCSGCNCSEYGEIVFDNQDNIIFDGYYTFNGTSTGPISICTNEDSYDCLCPYYGTHDCDEDPPNIPQCGFNSMGCEHCQMCEKNGERCHELNRIYKRASCIYVTQK